MNTKYCTKCKKEKSISEFYGNIARASRHMSWCKKCELKYKKVKTKKFLVAWLPHLRQNPICELCKKKLYYFNGNRLTSVHFDHKNNNLPIKGRPNHWLRRHKPTADNLNIWNSCSFGVLCYKCNRILPAENRDELLKNLVEYLK